MSERLTTAVLMSATQAGVVFGFFYFKKLPITLTLLFTVNAALMAGCSAWYFHRRYARSDA